MSSPSAAANGGEPPSAAAATTLPLGSPTLPAATNPLPLQAIAPRVRTPHPIFGSGWAQTVAGVNVHNTVKFTLDIEGTRLSLWRRAILHLVAQWDVGAHLAADFDSHEDDPEWRIINISVRGWMLNTMSLELQGLLLDTGSTAFAL
ncbi:hypothetical protein ACUV84_002980 [Puccinellia chinampoensis]